MTTQFLELNEAQTASPEKDRMDRSIAIGVLCTLLFHVFLVCLAPFLSFDRFSGSHSDLSVTNTGKVKTFDFELAQPEPEKPKNPFKFVETNAAAPENTPDKTENFSSRNQQTANPDADPNNASRRPKVKGQDEIKNETDIVAGDRTIPQQGSTAQNNETKAQKDQEKQLARAEQVPLTGDDKIQGTAEDGIATNVAHAKDTSNQAEKMVEGALNGKSPAGGLVAQEQMSKVKPKERPRLNHLMAARTILQNNPVGSSNVGVMAIDAFKSEYGEYLAELREIIETQWYAILENSATSPPRGTHVLITFRLNSKGEITIDKVEETAGKYGTFACQSAIQDRQPYRKWSDAMINLLGNEQTLGFDFYYQ